MMKKELILTCIFIFVYSFTTIAQLRTIEGTVNDDKGNPLQNVTVKADGVELSTTTDENGYYKLTSVPESVLILRFSHPNMENASSSLGIYNIVNIKMTKLGSENLELSMEDLFNMAVITASKKAEKPTDAPGVISTITKEEIKYFGSNNLTDILERSTSIQKVSSHLFPSNISAVRGDLRTLYDNHTLILINGRPIRDGVLGGVNSQLYLGFPVDMIEKIEIIRGPGSVLYGSNAFTSVINIITKDNNNKNSIGASVAAGSFNTTSANVNGSYIKNDFKAKISTKIDHVEGWDYEAMTAHPDPTLANLPVKMKYGRQNYGIATDLSYKGLSFFGLYTYDNQDVLGILPYATYAGKNKLSRLIMNLGYTHEFSDLWEASLNVSFNNSDLDIGDEAETPKDHQESTDYLAELTINGEPLKNVNLVVGGVIDSRNKYHLGSYDGIAMKYNQIHLSSYLQADYKPIEKLKLIVGAQLNKPEVGDVDIVPRLGAIFNITNKIGIKTLYASAFRSPWPVEQFLTNPAIVGNPNLSPEKINTLDIQLFYSSKKAEASITYFNSDYSNSITRAPLPEKPGVFTYINEGKLHMNGLELEGKVSFTSNIFITGSATIQNNKDEKKVAVYKPDFMGKIGVFYKTDFGLTAGIYNSYFGKPKENKGEVVNQKASDIDLLSINLNYKLPSLPIELNIFAQNILNSSAYYYPEFARGWVNTLPMYPEAGIYGKISFKF